MKNYVKTALSVCFLSLAFSGFSQLDDFREKFTAGPKAGINFSNVWDENKEDFTADWKVGFAGGGFVHIPIGKYLGIQPEILFSQKGFRGSGTVLGTDYSFKRTSNYLEVPLLFQVKPASFLSITLGPQFAFLLSEKDEFTIGELSATELEEFENKNIRKNMLGAVLGLDFNFNHFVVSPRVGWDFQFNNGDGTNSSPRYKNQWLQLTLGYRF